MVSDCVDRGMPVVARLSTRWPGRSLGACLMTDARSCDLSRGFREHSYEEKL